MAILFKLRSLFLLGCMIFALQISVDADDNKTYPSDVNSQITVTEVGYDKLWEVLKKTSLAWPQIIDTEIKEKIVAEYIQIYKQQGVKITNSSSYYTKRIDEVYRENPELFTYSFDIILQNVAIMDYDFDNRQDKDKLAKQLLGEKGYLANKKRLKIK